MTLLPRRYVPRDNFGRIVDELMRMPDLWEDDRSSVRGISSDLYETEDSVVVETAIPGVKPEDIKINVVGDTLTISGSSKQEEAEEKRAYYHRQLRYGSFAQSFTLPSSVKSEAAEAHFDHGMLKVVLPKAEEAKPKQIQIKVK